MKLQAKAQQGFTLIELMIVIAIVGILAAIALPAYQDYTVRAKMSEPLAALAEAKTTISEYYVANNSLPNSQAVSGIQLTRNTEILQSIVYSSNGNLPLLSAVVKSEVVPGSAGDVQFDLSGYTAAGRVLQWKCKPGATDPIETKYLPANCRG
tara:strand:- start:206161 stop:206619 length:459 start_codon:yes stop_codon:yes gene_type:complete